MASAVLAAIALLTGTAFPEPAADGTRPDIPPLAATRQYPCDWPDEWELCADPLRWPTPTTGAP
jgi:hypothetical protein